MWKSRICRCAGLWKTLGKLLEIPENLVFSLHIFNRTGCGKLLWTFVRTDAAPHRVQRFTGRSFPQHHCTVCGGTAADNDRMPEQRPSPEYSITAAKSKKQNRAVALRCNSHIKFALPLVRAAFLCDSRIKNDELRSLRDLALQQVSNLQQRPVFFRIMKDPQTFLQTYRASSAPTSGSTRPWRRGCSCRRKRYWIRSRTDR